MYIDKDNQGYFSLMKITREEIEEFAAILREFEYLIQKSDTVALKTKGQMVLLSSKLRFQIIDAVREYG